jgi:hydrogenase small subunit
MTPFYAQMPDLVGFGVERTADVIGAAAAAGAAAGVAAHAVATGVHRMRQRRKEVELPVLDQPDQPEPGKEDDRGHN